MRDRNKLSSTQVFLLAIGITSLAAVAILTFAARPAGATQSSFSRTNDSGSVPIRFFQRSWLQKAGRSIDGKKKPISPVLQARIEADEADSFAYPGNPQMLALSPLADLVIFTYSPESDSLYRFNSANQGR